nr:MAG TPA: hypothetical protein [Caudoviricetes sp.]
MPVLWVHYARRSVLIGGRHIKITIKGLEFPSNKT